MAGKKRPLEQRFWERVTLSDPPEDCWSWRGYTNPAGYGICSLSSSDGRVKTGYAHRTAYELSYGPIPEGLVIDHLCRNRSCINPTHVEVVTRALNTKRGYWPNGHPGRPMGSTGGSKSANLDYTHDCTKAPQYIRPNGRAECQLCHRKSQASYRAKIKAKLDEAQAVTS